MTLIDNETRFYYFPEGFDQKRVSLKTTSSPRDPPGDSKMPRTAPDPPTDMSPKWVSNPQIYFGTKISNPLQESVHLSILKTVLSFVSICSAFMSL